MNEHLEHSLTKMLELSGKGISEELTTRDVFQLGYNAGRASEISGQGREEWWDLLKGHVEARDWKVVHELMEQKMTAFNSSK